MTIALTCGNIVHKALCRFSNFIHRLYICRTHIVIVCDLAPRIVCEHKFVQFANDRSVWVVSSSSNAIGSRFVKYNRNILILWNLIENSPCWRDAMLQRAHDANNRKHVIFRGGVLLFLPQIINDIPILCDCAPLMFSSWKLHEIVRNQTLKYAYQRVAHHIYNYN